MKPIRHLPRLDDFKPYVPTAEPLSPARCQRFEPAETLSRRQLMVSWTCRAIAAAIMLETWWRYGQGVWELIASVLLLMPRTVWAGGLLTLAAIGAAIVSHLTVLGI